MKSVPEGFAPSVRSSAYLDLIGPIYEAGEGSGYRIGLYVDDRHVNGRGLCHGAMLAAIADVYLGRLIATATARTQPLVTIHLGSDYMAPAALGSWLQITGKIDRIGRSLAYSSGIITADDKAVLRCSAVFKIVSRG